MIRILFIYFFVIQRRRLERKQTGEANLNKPEQSMRFLLLRNDKVDF
jgi:hypothetical protein